MTRVTRKQTSSRFRTLLYLSCHDESTVKHINQCIFYLNGCRISGYFDTKFNAVGLIELILHKFEDLKISNFLNPEEVYFLVTRVICAYIALLDYHTSVSQLLKGVTFCLRPKNPITFNSDSEPGTYIHLQPAGYISLKIA